MSNLTERKKDLESETPPPCEQTREGMRTDTERLDWLCNHAAIRGSDKPRVELIIPGPIIPTHHLRTGCREAIDAAMKSTDSASPLKAEQVGHKRGGKDAPHVGYNKDGSIKTAEQFAQEHYERESAADRASGVSQEKQWSEQYLTERLAGLSITDHKYQLRRIAEWHNATLPAAVDGENLGEEIPTPRGQLSEAEMRILIKHSATLLRASRYALNEPHKDHAGYLYSVAKLLAVLEHYSEPQIPPLTTQLTPSGVSKEESSGALEEIAREA